jgi:xanthine dehydrogenase YagR molybdenum-binding subunit
LTGALGNAVHATCVSLVRAFVDLVNNDEGSPLKGCRLDGITVRDGGMQITDDPVRFETYADILTRHGLDELAIEGESCAAGRDVLGQHDRPGRSLYPVYSAINGHPCTCGWIRRSLRRGPRRPGSRHGARRSRRVGRRWRQDTQPKTARSQIIGGIAMGIGMALLEETVSDRTGRLATTSLAEYVVAVNADVRDVDILFVGDPDPMTPLGTKGVGELAIAGMAAAIANAIYHATGTRIRSLPISIEKMLGQPAPLRR